MCALHIVPLGMVRARICGASYDVERTLWDKRRRNDGCRLDHHRTPVRRAGDGHSRATRGC